MLIKGKEDHIVVGDYVELEKVVDQYQINEVLPIMPV